MAQPHRPPFPSLPLPDRVSNLQSRQGTTTVERALINGQELYYAPHGTPNPGVNSTFSAALDGVRVACFHKTFSGQDPAIAAAYGQSVDTPPIHECAAWQLAKALGTPYDQLVPTCVFRKLSGGYGSLALGIDGQPADPTPLTAGHPAGAAAAFFDSLVGQQDRHVRNFRWNAASSRLWLIDNGYAFARPHDLLNASVFVTARWNRQAQSRTGPERLALEGLLASPDLHGLGGILESPRADCLRSRAERMLARGEITKAGDF
jgi:hypothetical protein